MGEIKNPFSFGTGDIDKDQWLRDIDNELEDFITRYGSATNKHRTALLRLAFLDLRGRIASGDMLNRTADGNYQFGSALNRDDKHMQEAYQRALGFMGLLARRQITSPTHAEEPEKKKIGSLEERYIRSLNPSGKLNTKAYWDNQTDDLRRESLTSFLNKELQEAGNYNDFEGFGTSDEYKKRLNTVLGLLNSKTANDYSLQQLGFTLNWLTKPKDEEEIEEKAKTDLEQVQADIAAAQEALLVTQGRQYLSYNANRGTTDFNLNVPTYDFNKALLNYLNGALSDTQLRQAAAFNPNFNPNKAKAEQARNYVAQQQLNLNNYFANFATSWRSNYESGQANRNVMQNYLSHLFATYNKGTNQDGTPITDYAYDWKKYFTLIGDNQFLINGSLDRNTGRYAYYVPGQGIRESNVLDTSNPYIAQLLGYIIPSLKEGGKVEFLQSGGGFDYDAWAASQEKPTVQVTNKPLQTSASKLKTSPREMTAADMAAIGADIGSIVASFVPGYGTAASAVLGVGSTLANFISDVNDSNTSLEDALWNGAKGLGADAIGLVPGFGAGAKGWKIATRLAKYGTSILAGLNTLNLAENSPEIMNSFKKVLSLKTDDMDLLDWRNIQNGLSMLATAGRLGHGIAVHTGYKGLLKVTNPKPTDTAVPKTRIEKAKAKLNNLKGKGNTYDYGGLNNLPWYHDANIYLWGANQKGLSFGLKNPYKVNMLDHMKAYGPTKVRTSIDLQLPFSPKKSVGESANTPKLGKLNIKNPIYANRNMKSVNRGTKKAVYMKQIGGILKALRNGGILKAYSGLQFPDLNPNGNFNSEYYLNWVNLNWGNPENLQSVLKGYKEGKADFRSKNGLPVKGGDQLRYENANGDQDFMSAYQEQLNYYNKNQGANIFGDVRAYYNALKTKNPNLTIEDFITLYNSNVDKLRELAPKKLTGVANLDKTWGEYNTLFNEMYGSYSPFSEDLKDTLGESTWRRIPNTFNGINDRENLRHGLLMDSDPKSKVIIDNTGHLVQPDLDGLNNNGVNEKGGEGKSGNGAVDKEIGIKTPMELKLKDPWDPTLLTIAGKTWLGLSGNKNIFGNLLNEMPQAPLRDPIDRKLAILGWQDQIKQGLNQLADLRNIYGKLIGADSQVNLGGALEVEGKGRGIMDDKYMKDSLRQFDTAQKSWNLDNEDYLYNIKVGDDNRRAIADRARMMAQIRAAWRSGDNNILMGALSDASNWLLKKYQREQDVVNLARELQLGTRELFLENYVRNANPTYDALKAEYETTTDEKRKKEIKNTILKWLLDAMRKAPTLWSEKIYNTFHTPGFGGGYLYVIAKDGTKLEVAKLKARSKDNDRYVSMIKDLRTSRRRRRR